MIQLKKESIKGALGENAIVILTLHQRSSTSIHPMMDSFSFSSFRRLSPISSFFSSVSSTVTHFDRCSSPQQPRDPVGNMLTLRARRQTQHTFSSFQCLRCASPRHRDGLSPRPRRTGCPRTVFIPRTEEFGFRGTTVGRRARDGCGLLKRRCWSGGRSV